jgi:FkbM family methyltransferase
MIRRDQLTRVLPSGLRKSVYDRLRAYRFLRNKLSVRDGVVTHKGVRLRADDRLGPDVVLQMMNGDYEGREARMVRMFLDPRDVVLELGAGVGFIGLLCAKIAGADNVHSFEANPLMEQIILENYRLNNCSPRLSIGMLSDRRGEVKLYVPDLFWAASTSPIPGAREVTTVCLPFNETIGELRPTFLIMDIEGGEVDIVDMLEPGIIRKIAMERHPEITGEGAIIKMDRRLSKLGFARRWVSNGGQHAYFATGKPDE